MSGIGGLWQRRGTAQVQEALAALMAALAPYGPDGSGQWVQGGVGLGHQRLIITPESRHEQPPIVEAAALVITADVRLDNREALGRACDMTPAEQAQLSDSRLILRAYHKWGRACPAHLVGDFAFAIWDGPARTLFCARDHIGARPFYYSLTPERFVFASDIDGVLAVPGASTRLNEAYVAAYLTDRFFYHSEYIFFEALRKLPPGHSLTVQTDTTRLERYWFPERLPEVRLSCDAEYAEAFLDLYTQAVHARLRTVQAVGVHLSGGLDSSSTAVLAARNLRQQGKSPPAAFCWQPPPAGAPQPGSEHALIQAVCDQEGLTPHYQTLTADDIIAVWQRDPARGPVTSTLLHEQLVQQQAAAQGIRVLLSGWGGDEGIAFNGRGYFAGLLAQGQWRRLYQESQARGGRVWPFIFWNALVPLLPGWAQRLGKTIRHGPPGRSQTSSYLHPDVARRVRPLRPRPVRTTGVRSTQLDLLAFGHLTERIEAWGAHGARHHLVYGYPLLDRRLLEFALGLPPEQFRRGKWSRWLMRTTLEKLLPAEICWHRDKRDPIRLQQLFDALPGAMAMVRHRLEARPTPPARAMYLDLTRLRQDLTRAQAPAPDASGSPLAPAVLTQAVQLLDF